MLEVLVGIAGTAGVGAIGWAFVTSLHTANRVAIVETQRLDLITLITSKFDDVSRRLGRIESAMNGHIKE